MFDFCYKLIRKSMPKFVYEAIRGSFFGRKKLIRLDHYRNIFSIYKEAVTGTDGRYNDFSNKTVLEVGCGNQIFTALFLLAEGCKKVILLDPLLEIFNDDERFRRSLSLFKTAMPEFSLSENEIRKSLLCINDFQNIPDTFNDKIDIILSHQTLEHFNDLDIFFSSVYKLLSFDGMSFNKVDLSDHTYHIFDRFKFISLLNRTNNLNHLRYSAKQFALLNDSKCFMNRQLLPVYLRKAADHGLICKITKKSIFGRNIPIHRDVVEGLDFFDEKELKTTSFEMFLFKNLNQQISINEN